MKALILNNKVVDIQENEFLVHSSMTWVDCDDTVKVGFDYDGSTFISNEPTAEEIATAQAMRMNVRAISLTIDYPSRVNAFCRRRIVSSRPRISILSNNGGPTVRPVIATLIGA